MPQHYNPFATQTCPVDVLTPDGWVNFDTIKEAAAFIGVSHSFLSVALRKDIPCKGYQVKRHNEKIF